MVAVFTVLFVLALSLTVIRVAAVGLALTGISRDLAQFQALSAFTGSGFTTKESEEIVNHPVRRRIVMHLMLLGNAGIVVAIASVLRLVLDTDGGDDWYESFWGRLLILFFGVGLLWIASNSRTVEMIMWRVNAWALTRWSKIEVRDYTRLFHLSDDFGVSELRVHEGDWLAGHSLKALQLSNEGVLVLGIERRGGHYVGTPRGETVIDVGDCLIMYGRQEVLAELHSRSDGVIGNMRHIIAVTRQNDLQEQETSQSSTGE